MNKKVFATILLSIGILFIGTMPNLAFAQTGQNFDPVNADGSIVPQCTGEALGNGLDENECTFCDFMQLVRNVLNFILFFAVITAGALFAWAGWLFVIGQGSNANHAKAKSIFRNVIIGLVIVLGAYTVVDTLMKTLAGGNFTTGWSEICPDRN